MLGVYTYYPQLPTSPFPLDWQVPVLDGAIGVPCGQPRVEARGYHSCCCGAANKRRSMMSQGQAQSAPPNQPPPTVTTPAWLHPGAAAWPGLAQILGSRRSAPSCHHPQVVVALQEGEDSTNKVDLFIHFFPNIQCNIHLPPPQP